jgi:hypothetical protein
MSGRTYPVTLEARAAALTAALRANPPRLRLTRGMVKAAERMENRRG